MPDKKVAIIMGSDSDLDAMSGAIDQLAKFGIPYDVRILSAHRCPDAVARFAETAEAEGFEVIIAGAGKAAHLAGVIAAKTCLPVIGVPMVSDLAGGLDSLLSMAQMPGGVPVATMGTGKSGATNAGVLAAQILARSDPELRKKLIAHKAGLAAGVAAASAAVRSKLGLS